MIFNLNKPEYSYELENICRLFFPSEKIASGERKSEDEPYASAVFSQGQVECEASAFGKEKSASCRISDSNDCERIAAEVLFRLFSSLCGFSPEWGVLTGVRPAKLFSSLSHEYDSRDKARKYFEEKLLVAPDKVSLCEKALDAENASMRYNHPNSFSLYVSIPFCPSRCSYCSFVSHSIANAGKLIPDYVRLLCDEIKHTAKITSDLGLELTTVYFGGGTPTQLSAEQLGQIMETIAQNFDLSKVVEYTVEAGRPDTVTKEKLITLKKFGCSRISINPQTLDDSVLEKIGRRHTSQQTLDAFALAREVGFDNINMDVIAGLTGDTTEGFIKTVDGIIDLSPENITVHTLAIKRSSTLVRGGNTEYSADSITVSDMLKISSHKLEENGYSPYYLYRQSKMLGNHENVGWSKKGFDCLYNIYMMNELHTVLAVGAGAVSRLKDPFSGHIERIFNFKYPYEYIKRFDEMLGRKNKVGEFYEKYPAEKSLST